ncbi:N-acetyltransferase [Desulfovibrio porci]|uniref:GNAT family N-acetyltransferase n=1 Tax=Desulfovibrio porci TaxID=2605782 RepID=UPI002A80D8EC|nr:N-acetyltransferase [Desulfovibrio porci]MDY3809681.1 N-acetyltransferase [Desulfovibrio porci]
MPVTIRPESPEDFPAIHDLVRRAFEHAEHADGDEQHLVDRLRRSREYIPELTRSYNGDEVPVSRLRRSREYIPELSLVAEEDGRIVGHVMFSRVKVGEAAALALAPLAVLPSHHGRGIGGALVRRGHELARALGWEFVILLGHAGYYPRFGYRPASSFGIVSPFEAPEEAFMAVKLGGDADRLPGMVAYSPAFFPEHAG